MKVTELELSSN